MLRDDNQRAVLAHAVQDCVSTRSAHLLRPRQATRAVVPESAVVLSRLPLCFRRIRYLIVKAQTFRFPSVSPIRYVVKIL